MQCAITLVNAAFLTAVTLALLTARRYDACSSDTNRAPFSFCFLVTLVSAAFLTAVTLAL